MSRIRWERWAPASGIGYLVLFGAVLLVAFFFFPIMVLWAWILLVSVVVIVRAPSSQPKEPGMPEATWAYSGRGGR